MTQQFAIEVPSLLSIGLPVIAACAPSAGGGCTAPYHHHQRQGDIGKVPLVRGYPDLATRPPPREELERLLLLPFPTNFGLVVPVGMVVIDADSPEADSEFYRYLPPGLITPTRAARPGRGRGWLLRVPPSVPVHSGTRRGQSGHIDVLGRGSFFIVPPSIHLTGHKYEWVIGQAPWEVGIAEVPRAAWGLLEPKKKVNSNQPDRAVGNMEFSEVAESEVTTALRLVNARSTLRHLFEGKKDYGDTSQSGIDFSLARELLKLRVKPEVVAAVLLRRPGVHRATKGYVQLTVANAIKAGGGR